MDLANKDQTKNTSGFVVNTLTTANQRASSKNSTGSAHSFVQKLVGQSKLSFAGATNVGTPSNVATLSNVFKNNNYLASFAAEDVKPELGQRTGSIPNNQASVVNMQGVMQG